MYYCSECQRIYSSVLEFSLYNLTADELLEVKSLFTT